MTEVVANSLVAMQELDKLQAAQGREAPSELLQRAFDVPVCLSEEDAPLEFDPVVPPPGRWPRRTCTSWRATKRTRRSGACKVKRRWYRQ